MIDTTKRKEIRQLLQREVIPAIGCTEPMAVALCVARSRELLGDTPTAIEVRLSANILKNAMGVGIPGTDMIGLPIAVALGALIGHSDYELEVLKDVTPEAVARGRKLLAEGVVSIVLKESITEVLYIEVCCRTTTHSATAIIANRHTQFVYLSKDNNVLLDTTDNRDEVDNNDDITLNLRTVYDYATTTPLEELEFIDEARRLNMAAADFSLRGNYGHSLGRTLLGQRELHVMGNGIFSKILAYTSAACDARMAGAMVQVMSNSGSGNQGIAATVPVAVYAEQVKATHDQVVRALILSHLTAVYIKQSLGRLSALCGCVVAGTGSSCGITYLMGGGYREIAYAVKNMIANLTGMICDGAKPSCALKVTSGVSTAVMSALIAMEGKCVTSVEGIIDEDVDRSIRNLTQIGRDGMATTDRMVLDIMTHKTGGC
jgi:L-cysteine desulfidase